MSKTSGKARILIVDDEKCIRLSFQAILRNEGYAADVAEDADRAQAMLLNSDYDVVVTDIVLPGVSGVELLKAIRFAAPPDVQVIMVTGDPTMETAADAVRSGACDYLIKPVGKDAMLRSVATAAHIKQIHDEKRRLEADNRRYQANLEELVGKRTDELRLALNGFVRAMAAAVESRDPYTAGHQQRVADLSRRLAQEMALPEEKVLAVYYAGLIHDLGKISIPAEILSTPAKLSRAAMDIIREHPATAYEILKDIPFSWPIAEIIRQHHERQNGTGYPRGLSGEAISLEARILAVADVVEAMASHRPYRPALGMDAALEEIIGKRDTVYDARAVDACVRLFREQGYHFQPGAPGKTT